MARWAVIAGPDRGVLLGTEHGQRLGPLGQAVQIVVMVAYPPITAPRLGVGLALHSTKRGPVAMRISVAREEP